MTDASAFSAPPAREVRSPLSDGEWHRMHPLTPLLRGGVFLLVVAGIVIANLRERLLALVLPVFAPELDGGAPADPIDYIIGRDLLVTAGLVLLGVVVVLTAVFTLSWRFHTFRITGDDVEVRSGILFRTHRRAPLDRVQGVNLTRPLVARLLGMGKLEVVGAGSDANVKLEYLSTSNAETIRSDILRLASGRRLGEARGETGAGVARVRSAASVVGAGLTGLVDGEDQSDLEPESVVHIPPGRLIASRLLSGTTLMLLALIAAIVVGSVLGTVWVLFSVIPTFLGFGAYYVRSITRALRYSIAPMPSGVRVTFGLFTTISETLPPGRIHAVEVRQSIFWRPFGWWSITVNRLSGRAAGDTAADQFASVLPVGTRADVERVLKLLLPALPDGDAPFVFDHGILGPGAGDPYTTTPARARLLRPLSWRRNGFLLTGDALFLRRGYIWRALGVLPLARMQSVGLAQGPVDRALGVANLTAHVVAGGVTTTVGILDRDEALRGFADAADAIVAAAAGDRSHRWASVVAGPVGAGPVVAGPVGGGSVVAGPVGAPESGGAR